MKEKAVVYCSDRNPDKMGNTKGFAFVAQQRIETCGYRCKKVIA